MDEEQGVTLYCDIETKEERDIVRESHVSSDIAQAIHGHSELHLRSLYDLIMNNREVVTKDELIFLLEKLGRPKRNRKSQVDKKSTRAGLETFMGFANVEFSESGIPTSLNKTEKNRIIEWLESLKPTNPLEQSLKLDYLKAEKEFKKGLDTKAVCFNDIYKRVCKDVLKKKKKKLME